MKGFIKLALWWPLTYFTRSFAHAFFVDMVNLRTLPILWPNSTGFGNYFIITSLWKQRHVYLVQWFFGHWTEECCNFLRFMLNWHDGNTFYSVLNTFVHVKAMLSIPYGKNMYGSQSRSQIQKDVLGKPYQLIQGLQCPTADVSCAVANFSNYISKPQDMQ